MRSVYTFKTVSVLLGIALATGGLSAFAQQTAESTRTIQYYGDRKVVVPVTVTRIATAWEAQNAIIAMLGHGEHIVASTRIVRDMPVFRKFVPSIRDVPLASRGGGDLNVEELIRLQPQVLFLSSPPSPAQAAQLQRAGIAVAAFRANSLPALVERTMITGDILGDTAREKAKQYQAYFNNNVERVRKALATLPVNQRKRIYHAVGTPLSTSGRPSLNQDWMDLAGVENIAEQWFGGSGNASANVSLEQIIAGDPDIIVAMRSSDAQTIRTDPRWRNLRAVKEGRVHANPRGMFWWCRETSETALQFLWLAKLAYPEQMKHIDMREETRHFYRTFYGYTLSDQEIDEFLNPQS